METNELFEILKEHRHDYVYGEAMVKIEDGFLAKIDWVCNWYGHTSDEDIEESLQNLYDLKEEDGYYLVKFLGHLEKEDYGYGSYQYWLEFDEIEFEYQLSLEEMEKEINDNIFTDLDLFNV